jgi:hypothetical protein
MIKKLYINWQVILVLTALCQIACSGGFYVPPTLVPITPTKDGEQQLTGGMSNRGASIHYSKAYSPRGVFFVSAQSGIKNGIEASPFTGLLGGFPINLPTQTNLRHLESGWGRYKVKGEEFKWINSFQLGASVSDFKSYWPDSTNYNEIFKGRQAQFFGQFHLSFEHDMFEMTFSQRIFWGRFWQVSSVENFYNEKYLRSLWGTDINGTLGVGRSWFRPFLGAGLCIPFQGFNKVNPFMIFNGTVGIAVRFNQGPFAPKKQSNKR